MTDCPQCSVAAVKAKDAFNRVADATQRDGVNKLPDGSLDWDSFCKAVNSSLAFALTPTSKKRRGK